MSEAAGLPDEATSPTVVSSPDGRSFRLRTSADEGLRPGDYVTIADGEGAEHLGYVESVDEVTETTTWAAGSILPGPITPAPFRSGSARRSDSGAVRDFFGGSGATLPVGTLVSDPSVEVGLIPKRINRHTFWEDVRARCGPGADPAPHPAADGDLRSEQRLRPTG
jgi:hypothetical protein